MVRYVGRVAGAATIPAPSSRPARRSRRARSVVAESVLVKHQLLILNRSRKRSPNLRASDRVAAGLVRRHPTRQ
jgi:hypothetical protein